MKKPGTAITTSAVLLLSAACGQANSANRTPEAPRMGDIGIHTLEHGEAIGLGSQQYELITLR